MTISDERLSEMVGAGVPCVPAQPGEIAAVVQELRSLRSKPVAGVEVKPLDIADTCDGVEQDAFEAWASSRNYDMHEHPMHYLFLDPKTDAARMGWKAGIEHARQRILSTLSIPAKEPVAWQYRCVVEGAEVEHWSHWIVLAHDPTQELSGNTFQVRPLYASPQPIVITEEMVERLRAGIISASGSWHPSLNQCRDLLAALKEA